MGKFHHKWYLATKLDTKFEHFLTWNDEMKMNQKWTLADEKTKLSLMGKPPQLQFENKVEVKNGQNFQPPFLKLLSHWSNRFFSDRKSEDKWGWILVSDQKVSIDEDENKILFR